MLRRLFDVHGCDKGTERHRYDRCYGYEFAHLRMKPLNFLEIGIYEGKSIEAWLDYFPNATIYCIDTFERIDAAEIDVLSHERVKWMQQSSTAPDCTDKIKQKFGEDIQFDIIIDDGAHWLSAIRKTFVNFFPLLKPGGAYYIEDVHNMELPEVAQYLKRSKTMQRKKYKSKFNVERWNELMYTVQQYNVEHFNYIKGSGNPPDSYILKITHDHI